MHSFGFIQGVENLLAHTNLNTDVYNNFTHNLKSVEATKMSFIRWRIDELVYSDNGSLFCTKKKWAMKAWEDMKETKMYITK